MYSCDAQRALGHIGHLFPMHRALLGASSVLIIIPPPVDKSKMAVFGSRSFYFKQILLYYQGYTVFFIVESDIYFLLFFVLRICELFNMNIFIAFFTCYDGCLVKRKLGSLRQSASQKIAGLSGRPEVRIIIADEPFIKPSVGRSMGLCRKNTWPQP